MLQLKHCSQQLKTSAAALDVRGRRSPMPRWEESSCNPGTTAPEHCERALCDIVRRLQQHFDIAPT
jgi:hypothetical protein